MLDAIKIMWQAVVEDGLGLLLVVALVALITVVKVRLSR